jgi:hypothetical protein
LDVSPARADLHARVQVGREIQADGSGSRANDVLARVESRDVEQDRAGVRHGANAPANSPARDLTGPSRQVELAKNVEYGNAPDARLDTQRAWPQIPRFDAAGVGVDLYPDGSRHPKSDVRLIAIGASGEPTISLDLDAHDVANPLNPYLDGVEAGADHFDRCLVTLANRQ